MSMTTSIYCALPLVPILFEAWRKQFSASKTASEASKKATSITADKALDMYLRSEGLEAIPVKKSENYLQNEYIAEDNSIYLSPDTLGSVDVVSVSLALHAGAQAKSERSDRGLRSRLKALHNLQSIAYWTAFCVLAVGIMAGSVGATIAGYALAAGGILAGFKRHLSLKHSDEQALSFARKTQLLPEEQLALLEKAFAADRVLR